MLKTYTKRRLMKKNNMGGYIKQISHKTRWRENVFRAYKHKKKLARAKRTGEANKFSLTSLGFFIHLSCRTKFGISKQQETEHEQELRWL
jgi:hypothetical protein